MPCPDSHNPMNQVYTLKYIITGGSFKDASRQADGRLHKWPYVPQLALLQPLPAAAYPHARSTTCLADNTTTILMLLLPRLVSCCDRCCHVLLPSLAAQACHLHCQPLPLLLLL